ncbi:MULTISPECIES: hypothetical protein [Streptomyces]|uniref:Lipoprotein n=2 Tax=Streptomyces TaxID=1883 RepID=A0ABU4KDW8_9ACTN|nr:hypothetical protein [Streptomyces roseolus]MDX2295974.1 hypothetical protein [Streptomyces roseolus]
MGTGSWRSRPWLLWALLAVPAAATIAGAGTYAGALGPQDPPKPGRADLVGRYEDGEGGVVTLRADGTAEVRGIEYDLYDDGSGVGKRCEDDAATWFLEETRPRWHNAVNVFNDCGFFQPWDVDGSPSDPRIVYYAGDPAPDTGRVLTRR